MRVQGEAESSTPKAFGDGRGSFYMFLDDDETLTSRRSSGNSQILSMSDVENQVKFEGLAPLASSETLKSTRPSSAAIQIQANSFLNKSRPQSEFQDQSLPKLPPKKVSYLKKTQFFSSQKMNIFFKASMKRSQYKSTGVLMPASGVSRRIALNKALTKQNMSNSESELFSKKKRRQRNPFADSDDSDDSADFVDLSELPPLPVKNAPPLLPKQKINKSKSTLRRIDDQLLAKYRSQSKESLATMEDLDDYEDLPTTTVSNDDDGMDYDEPIPHSTKVKQYVNM